MLGLLNTDKNIMNQSEISVFLIITPQYKQYQCHFKITVTLQIGQYGNQVGPSFFEKLQEQYSVQPLRDVSPYFRFSDKFQKLIPRAVLIDMEPKVIQKCFENQNVNYLQNQAIWRQSGSGNNWAHGYHHFGPLVIDEIMDKIRHESEQVDSNLNFLTFSSLAGGTGSGLSSFILQKLKDEYFKNNITSQTVVPFMRGEIATQNYNSILSLSAMQLHSDVIIPFTNDDARSICMKSLNVESPSFKDLNSVISTNLCLNLPISFITSQTMKMVSVRSSYSVQRNLKYYAVLSTAKQLILTGSTSDSQMDYKVTEKSCQLKYYSGLLKIYGEFTQSSADQSKSEVLKYQNELQQLQQVCRNSDIFRGNCCQIAKLDQKVLGNCAGLSLNGMLLGNELQQLEDELIKQLATKQYLHLYEGYGVDEGEILDAAYNIKQAVDDYAAL